MFPEAKVARRERGPPLRGVGESGYAGFPLQKVSLHLVNEGRIEVLDDSLTAGFLLAAALAYHTYS